MRSVHVAAAQIQSKAFDVQGNLDKMLAQIKSAAAVGVEAIIFAETCIHSYCMYPESVALAEPLGGPVCETVLGWAREYGMVIMAGMLEKSELGIHNSHVVAYPDGSAFTIRKHVQTPFEVDAKLVPGVAERQVFEINGVKCSLFICADSAMTDLYDKLKEKGVELLFYGTASGGYRKDYITEAEAGTPEGLLKYIDESRPRFYEPRQTIPAGEFKVAKAYANSLGDDGAFMTHPGHCLIVDRNRIVRAQINCTNVVEHFLDQMIHAVLYFD